MKNILKIRDCENKEHRRLSFYNIYIFAYLLVIAICAESEALANYGVIIPFIKINQAYPLLAITILGIAYILLFKQCIKVDVVTLLLMGRIILCLLPALLYDMPSSYIGNFVVSCFPLFIYLFFLNCNIDIKKASVILLWFGMVRDVKQYLQPKKKQKKWKNYLVNIVRKAVINCKET